VIFRNTDALKKQIAKRLTTEAENEIKVRLFSSANLVEAEAKQSIQRGVKSGRIYKRRSIVHQASAPGEPPASDTGFLVSNITKTAVEKSGTALSISVESKAPYSKFLEFGTRKMSARPFLQPALEKNRNKIKSKFAKGGFIK
jgi:HK97 gp10 family phage protein